MVAGARLALEAGWEVRGSDNPLYPPTSDMAASLGIPVAVGYSPENLEWRPDVVLIGNVLSRGNPEVEAVLERRMRYQSLPEWMKEHVLRPRRPVVICGTHGKTTTTALTAHLLHTAGIDSGYFIGGRPLDFPHSSYLGPEGAPIVIEGDEYDTAFFDKRAKFFHYLPEIAVVTSLEFDHGDIYSSLGEIELAFQRMLRQVPRSGWLIACADNAAASLVPHAFSNTTTYGFSADAEWRGELVEPSDGLQTLRVYHRGTPWTTLATPLYGTHNLQNLLAAVVCAVLLGVEPAQVQAGARSFQGVKRRLEVFLEAAGITFVDDFAHHPTAIKETIAAARSRWPGRRLRVLFEPRSNTTVTNDFYPELLQAFSTADELWVGPIHRVEKLQEDRRLDRERLASELRQAGVPAQCRDLPEDIAAEVVRTGQPGDVVLILSNGAFGGIYRHFQKDYETVLVS
jgi:UDP-N-acetylmuramate: L-alanyl-gamma-D-glutamyl-meso-diaminopimelate ligase